MSFPDTTILIIFSIVALMLLASWKMFCWSHFSLFKQIREYRAKHDPAYRERLEQKSKLQNDLEAQIQNCSMEEVAWHQYHYAQHKNGQIYFRPNRVLLRDLPHFNYKLDVKEIEHRFPEVDYKSYKQNRSTNSSNIKKPKEKQQSHLDKNESCIICLQRIEDGELTRTVDCCSNIFHGPCIKRWFTKYKAICPICRYVYSPLSDDKAPSPSSNLK